MNLTFTSALILYFFASILSDGIEYTPENGACENSCDLEVFEEQDKPYDLTIGSTEFSISTPWGYDRSANRDLAYPIVVNGNWGEGWAFTESIRQQHPAFFLEYQRCDDETDGEVLSELLDTAILQGMRIDLNRVYLTGFSKGGSGSYKLARGFLRKGKLFAAILRIAGQSQTVLPDEVVNKTSIWFHIGTLDEPLRLQVTKEAFENLKEHPFHETSVLSLVEDEVSGIARATKTLSKGGKEVVKYSVYTGMGHDPTTPYQDPKLFEWLFSQRLGDM